MNENELAEVLIECCFRIHRKMGAGLFESVYETLLVYELGQEQVPVRQQCEIGIEYKNLSIPCAFRADLILDNKLIVEIKSVETLHPVHYKQLLTYLRLTNIKLGILVNFRTDLLKKGIFRIANNL